MDDKLEIESTIIETEKYIDELEDQLCGYEDVVTQRNFIKTELTKGEAKLNSIKIEKTNILNEILRETKELTCKYNIQKEHMIDIQEGNNSLKCENEQMLNKLDGYQIYIEELKNIRSNLLENQKILEKKLSEAMEITNKLKERQQLAQSEVQTMEQDIICIQKSLTEQITQITEVEKNINIEQDRNECLQSSICELKMKSEKISKTLQAEMTKIRCKFNEKLAELCMLKLKLKDKQVDIIEFKNQTIQLEKERNCFQEEHCKEKCNIEKEIEELRVEIKSIASKLKCVNTKLCDAQMKSTKLKCQIKDQKESIKQLEPMKEILQQEVKKIKETTEATTEKIKTELQKYDNENQMFDRKLETKYREQCELKKLSKDQTDQLTKLKKKLSELKCNLAKICVPYCT